jgi:hypothetical protein
LFGTKVRGVARIFGRVQQNLDGAGFTYYRINFLMGAKYYQGVGRANRRLPCLRLWRKCLKCPMNNIIGRFNFKLRLNLELSLNHLVPIVLSLLTTQLICAQIVWFHESPVIGIPILMTYVQYRCLNKSIPFEIKPF